MGARFVQLLDEFFCMSQPTISILSSFSKLLRAVFIILPLGNEMQLNAWKRTSVFVTAKDSIR